MCGVRSIFSYWLWRARWAQFHFDVRGGARRIRLAFCASCLKQWGENFCGAVTANRPDLRRLGKADSAGILCKLLKAMGREFLWGRDCKPAGSPEAWEGGFGWHFVQVVESNGERIFVGP